MKTLKFKQFYTLKTNEVKIIKKYIQKTLSAKIHIYFMLLLSVDT